MSMDVDSAPSVSMTSFSAPRESAPVEPPSASSVPAAPATAEPFDGGTPVAHRHIDTYNPDVKVMQERMRDAGIDPGPIDGLKGPLTRAAMASYHSRLGKSASDGLKVDPSFAELRNGKVSPNADSFEQRKGQKSKLDLPNTVGGNLDAGATKDGNTLPATHGKATAFWNGHYAYKGKRDRDNMSIGAWGDANKPTDYFAALPVGLKGGGNWWHNKKLLITNPTTGKQVVVPVQDKGPHPKTGAAIDLSPVAKEALGVGFMDNLNVRISFARDDAPIGPVR